MSARWVAGGGLKSLQERVRPTGPACTSYYDLLPPCQKAIGINRVPKVFADEMKIKESTRTKPDSTAGPEEKESTGLSGTSNITPTTPPTFTDPEPVATPSSQPYGHSEAKANK